MLRGDQGEGPARRPHLTCCDADPNGIWAGYDAAAVREAIAEAAGRWADLDADAIVAERARAREEGARAANRARDSWGSQKRPCSALRLAARRARSSTVRQRATVLEGDATELTAPAETPAAH
jgi:hypothetical protein